MNPEVLGEVLHGIFSENMDTPPELHDPRWGPYLALVTEFRITRQGYEIIQGRLLDSCEEFKQKCDCFKEELQRKCMDLIIECEALKDKVMSFKLQDLVNIGSTTVPR